ncbi:hypothetical protein P8S54_06165 [Thiomicrospira sp. R3]|nr:hypothetical protein [Thiomicrospira sp. R3]WFE67816.1 hypothetical protein P8S54_06165 [Thiomicrospira sp. R3]
MMRLKNLIAAGVGLVLLFALISFQWQLKQLEQTTYKQLQAVNE